MTDLTPGARRALVRQIKLSGCSCLFGLSGYVSMNRLCGEHAEILVAFTALVAEAQRDVKNVIQRHRRHVQDSPGAGEQTQRYALAVLDDVEMDLQIVGLSEDPAARRAQESTKETT